MKQERNYNEAAAAAFADMQASLVGSMLNGFAVRQSANWIKRGLRRVSGSVSIHTCWRVVTVAGDFAGCVEDLSNSPAIGQIIRSVEITKDGLRIITAPYSGKVSATVVEIDMLSIESISISNTQAQNKAIDSQMAESFFPEPCAGL